MPSASVALIGIGVPIVATGREWNGPTMITAKTLTRNTAAGSSNTLADSAIPNMLIAVRISERDHGHE